MLNVIYFEQETPEDDIDTNSAYMLFYEQVGLNYGTFMPDTTGKEPDITEIDDECENDLKKCTIQ